METNQDKRRAIGQTNQDARRALGQANQDARRQLGRDMIERRTGVKQVQDINALLNPPRQQRTLQRKEPRGGLSGAVGTGTYTPPATGTGGGIASPLTEVSAAQREYFPETFIPTTDGLAWAKVRSVKKLVMVDANNAEVIMEFKDDTQQPG